MPLLASRFRRGFSKANEKKNPLCVLCDFAVNFDMQFRHLFLGECFLQC
ncbi:hypothetical protein D1AOALGA4SA_4619 [Olavius algarvensis Delta 1 endosymbiont]|nr:hypothetical protein D1AOALGA4SA_4619 [Olavius algarvensis Delta 1 endosymbiont]